MPPVQHSVADEAAFMDDLLSGLDATAFFAAQPSPDPVPASKRTFRRVPSSPLKPKTPKRVVTAAAIQSFSAAMNDEDLAALVDGAEDWDWSDMLTPKKAKPAKKAAKHVREVCTRCTVQSVAEIESNGRFQKNLTVSLDSNGERRTVQLLDDWIDTDVRAGDTINVLGAFSSPTISITAKENFVILHPDLLLTATTLANAPQCTRKPLLSLLVRSGSDTTPALVWGNMLHEVVQTCLRAGRWDEAWMDTRIEAVVRRGLDDLVRIGVGIEAAQREMKSRAKGLATFSNRYMADTPHLDAVLTNTRAVQGAETSLLAISRLHDVEEDIWSPKYGIKGKLDATVQARISNPPPPTPFTRASTALAAGPTVTDGPAPFEIKTGRTTAAMEHRAQTLLYTVLAEERYNEPVESGLLWYTQSEEVVRVPRARNELRGLINVRNLLAGYMIRRTEKRKTTDAGPDLEEDFLPPTIDDERICKRCYVADTCMLYRKAVEKVEDTDSPIADLYELKTGHLTPSQGDFFKKWEALLSLEEGDLVRFKKELWTLGARERELKGRCFADMRLDSSFEAAQHAKPNANRIHQFTYRFTRAASIAPASSLLNGHMNNGDAITVSIEPHLLALARGFIVELDPHSVVLGVDHELTRERLLQLSGLDDDDELIFRIDKDELSGGMGRIRDNLARLFYADGDTRRLELVVDLRPPHFDPDPAFAQEYLATSPLTAHLNDNQKDAMVKVLRAQDYALILGMPGTGKTTVIAALIRCLVALGKTVLLTSYTHSAVDNILIKLAEGVEGQDGFDVLRLGNIDKVHPDVQKHTLDMKVTATTIEQLERQIMTPPVVATTCLSIDHALFTRRTFDYCIVDEASQITLPTCLGPLRSADKFVLVGDHFQLPPLVRNYAARKGGLDVSLFRRLSESHPDAVVDLRNQYRMNSDIMLLSNKLIYGDRLRCGSEDVANRTLVLPNPTFMNKLHDENRSVCGGKQDCWIEKLLSESCRAVFVDTDDLPAPDSRIGDLVQNPTEAALVCQLTEALLSSGILPSQIGVISLYRQQIKLLTHMLEGRKGIEILTADRSQGRDKECIIISLVRSNSTGQIGELVKDWRRMNVSFTRARSKLVIFGSRKTLQDAPLLAEFFRLMESKNWIVKLPPGADKLHAHIVPSPSIGTPAKRGVDDVEDAATGKENADASPSSGRSSKVRRTGDEGVLRGRPILLDLINGEK